MFKQNNFKNKLFIKVWIVGIMVILGFTSAVVLFEKDRWLNKEFNRIYHLTYAIKNNLTDLAPCSDSSYLNVVFASLMSADSGILYFILTDTEGRVIVSDSEKRVGKNGFETATIKGITRPLFEIVHNEAHKTAPTRFVIYTSSLNENIIQEGGMQAVKDEAVLDAFWDVSCKETILGTFRAGFSRKGLKKHLSIIAFGMLTAGFLVLLVTTGLFNWIKKRNLKSLDALNSNLAVLNQTEEGFLFKRHLDDFDFESQSMELEEILEFKKKFIKFKNQVSRHWAYLEKENDDLEMKLGKDRKKLHQATRQLIHQAEERKEIETRLLNTQKLEAVGTLAGGIAHEFNNLFMAITGYASLIQRQSPPDHPNIDKARKILDIVNNGAQSVKQLLGFARSGKYTPGPLNINEVIRMSLDMFKKTRKDLVINVKYTSGIWKIYADRSQMEHVIMNLLLNASEAMPSNGDVTIETNNILLEKKQVSMDKVMSGRFVHFSIKDQGRGIQTKYLRRVFDPFFTTKPISAGTGLGLASVYGIVNNHNGFTTVESAVGRGTLFNVFLPAMKEEAKLKKKK